LNDKNYHPDGFVPMQTELFDDFKAMPKGSASDDIDALERAPLTNELIRDIQAMCHLKNVGYDTFIMRFARAIERAHGIV